MGADYIIKPINETEGELQQQLAFPALYATKVAHLKPGSRRLLEVLAVRVALKELFGGEEQEVSYSDEGCPSVSGPYHISISHTDGYVAVARSMTPVGIDIERRGNRVQKVVSHFLRPEEQQVLHACALDYQLALHLAWSAKEAAFKVLGKAYYDLMNLTTITQVNPHEQILLLKAEGKEEPLQLKYIVEEEYVFTRTLPCG